MAKESVLPAGVMCPRVCPCASVCAFSTVLFTLQRTTMLDNAASAKRVCVCVLVILIAVLQSKVTANVRSIVDKTRERKHTTGVEGVRG